MGFVDQETHPFDPLPERREGDTVRHFGKTRSRNDSGE